MRTLNLPDGRTLAFTTSGDPSTPAVIYHHGWPSSRLEAGLVGVPGVFLVAPDRPGYGGSSALPGRALLDWPADVAALADHLGIDTFTVAGVSGGGPYALACGAAMPERVRRVVLVNAVPPPSQPAGADIAWLRRIGRSPRLGRAALETGRRVLLSRRFDVRWALLGLPAVDRDCLTPELAERLLASVREGIRPGVAGALSDARIHAGNWGFSLAEIRVPVEVWQAAGDTVVRPIAIEAFRAIPNVRVTIVPDEGHYSLALRHAPRILAGLTGPLAAEAVDR